MNANFTMPELMVVQDASDNPRLARGLVREELRPYKAILERPIYKDMLHLLKTLVERHMPPTGKFSTNLAAKLLHRMNKEATRYLRPIKTFDSKIFLYDEDPKPSPVHGFLYWLPSKAEVNHLEPDKSFVGDFIELRCMRLGASRRRLMFDDTFCHFITSEHCLVRLLERGAAPRKALADLTSQIDTVLPAAIMFAIAYKSGHHNKLPNVLIPYKDGILLCKVNLFDITGDHSKWYRFRVVSDKKWTKTADFELEPLLMHKDKSHSGVVSVYAATYIPKMQMSSEQIWAKMQIEELLDSEQEYIPSYLKMVYMLEQLDFETSEHLPVLFGKVEKIMRNPRWKIATSLTLIQSS